MQKGQLGHGDLIQRNVPTEVTGLSGKIIITGEETVHAAYQPSVCQLLSNGLNYQTDDSSGCIEQVLAENSIQQW